MDWKLNSYITIKMIRILTHPPAKAITAQPQHANIEDAHAPAISHAHDTCVRNAQTVRFIIIRTSFERKVSARHAN